MSAAPPFQQAGPPPVPEGWRADWSPEHNTWYYFHFATQTSQWHNPLPQAQAHIQQPHDAGPPPPQQHPPQQYLPQQQQYGNVAVPSDPLLGGPGPDADRGLGKAVGMGILGTAGALLAGTFIKHEIDEHKQEHQNGKPHWHDFSSAGGGFFGAMKSKIPFPNGDHSSSSSSNPLPSNPAAATYYPPLVHQSSAYQPPPAPAGFFGGTASHNQGAGSNSPPLYIHCAVYCDKDVTQTTRSLVTPSQTLELNTEDDNLVKLFGDPWPGNRKQFSVLYSYGPRPWELLATGDYRGNITLLHQPLDKTRMEFLTNHDSNSRLLAVVWGYINGLDGGKGPIEKTKEIELTGEFQATNDWAGQDGMICYSKTAVAYYRTEHGGVGVACAREGGTCRLPWNPLAKWS